MKITFTDKCRENIIHAENGIKLNLKGYAFYQDTFKEDDIKPLLLTDIDANKIICKNKLKNIYDLRENVFDFTYIPALESSIITKKENEDTLNIIAAKMGQYEIDINKGLTDKSFKSILVIGEEFTESNTYVSDKEKIYLAAVISDINVNLEQPQKIVFKVSFTNFEENEIDDTLRVIDTYYNDFTENEIIKDFNTIQLPDNYTLTPDKKNNDFDKEINLIKFDSEIGYNNVKSSPSNLVLIDKTNKINNIWNSKSRVFLGVDNVGKKVVTPHLELSYGSKNVEDNVFQTNSVDFQYDTNHISINQSTGIKNLQVDILPEDMEVENKRCLKNIIKRNNQIDYSLVSANKTFFKYDSHNSKYTEGANHTFEFGNRNNTLGTIDYPVEYVSLIRSNNNTMSGNNFDTLILNSNDNKLGYSFTNSIVINSTGTYFENNGKSYNEELKTNSYESNFGNNVYIGTENVESVIDFSSISSTNITLIGKNKLSTYCVESANNVPLTDSFNTIPSIIETISSNVTSTANIDLGYIQKSYTDNLNIGHEALIGFNGLSVDRLPNEQVYFKDKEQIGFDEKTDTTYFYYSNPEYETDTTYSIKFGNYNANYNANALNAFNYDTITDYIDDENAYSNTFSSEFGSKTFNSEDEILYKLYFKHTQDSLYNTVERTDISADEGDFSINKLVVVGNGYDILGKNITGYSPAQMASKYYKAGNYCRKIDLFSIEKDSYQLVHDFERTSINYIDKIDDTAYVKHFPAIFAVRGTAPEKNKNSFNNYLLQNAIYSTSGIYIPRQRTSNDVYPLTWDTLEFFKSYNGYKPSSLPYNNTIDSLRRHIDELFTKDTSKFVYPCEGIIKENKISYDIYVSDIINDIEEKYKDFSIKIIQCTFYLINTGVNDLNFYGEIKTHNSKYMPSNLSQKRIVKPGDCIEVIYNKDFNTENGYNLEGVLNFDYNK